METSQIQEKLAELKEQARELRKQIPKKVRKQTLPIALTDEEFNKIINLIKPARKDIRTIFLLAYESGMRISEIVNLQKDNVNLTAKSIFIKQGKYSKDRVVPLPKTWKNYMIDLIPFKVGPRAIEMQFKNAVRKAGLRDDLHFHCLRHSFSMRCIEKGMPIHQLQLLLGHSSVQTTGVYLRANPIDALATYQKVF
jgi:integrase